MIVTRTALVSLFLALLIAAPEASAQAPAPAKAPAAARPKIGDIVVLKGGQNMMGDVQVPTFTLKHKYGTLQIPKNQILQIEYRKPPNKMEDEVQINAGTRLYGDLQPTPIKVDVSGLGVLTIPKSDIILIKIQEPLEDLSEATKKALGGRKP